MKKIRLGNDFIFLWKIERNGLSENFSNIIKDSLSVTRYIGLYGYNGETIEYEILDGGIIKIEVTPEIAPKIGKYYFELNYTLIDTELSDNDRKCRVDTDAFIIVERTAQADEVFEVPISTDISLDFKPVRFQDLTENELEILTNRIIAKLNI